MSSEGVNVFEGPNAVRNFLNPAAALPTPLVELSAPLNPFPASERVRIFLKAMYLTPLLNLKLYPAWRMLEEASQDGGLKRAKTLVENSSGNMALSLAILAPYFGVKDVRAIVPADIAGTKKELLHLAGVDMMFSTEAPGEPSGIEKAKLMGKKRGMKNLAQYENPDNPDSHGDWTARQVWEQTNQRITVFAAGMGTTGTVCGAADYFIDMGADVSVVGVLCAPGQAVPGVRSEAKLKDIRFDWRNKASCWVEVGAKESYRKSLELIRAGFMAGPSSGFAFAGLTRFLEENRADWPGFRNKDGDIVAVFVAGDTPLVYLDKYTTILDPEDFR